MRAREQSETLNDTRALETSWNGRCAGAELPAIWIHGTSVRGLGVDAVGAIQRLAIRRALVDVLAHLPGQAAVIGPHL